MSEPLRIALVAEGPTDYELIHAALLAVLPQPFHMTLLHPEVTRPRFGGGWGGVLKWCHDTSLRHTGPLSQDPTLSLFDLIILHVDADVATSAYTDYGSDLAALAQGSGWRALPCAQPCPPAADTCAALAQVLSGWLGSVVADARTVFCIPAQSTGAWLACAVLPPESPWLQGAECRLELENQLAILPKGQRIRKNPSDYRKHAVKLTSNWAAVKNICLQAAVFELAVISAVS